MGSRSGRRAAPSVLTAGRWRTAGRLIWTLVRGWNLVYSVPTIAVLLMASFYAPRLFEPPQLLSSVPVQAPTSAALSVLLAILTVASVPEPCPTVFDLAPLRRRAMPLVRVSLMTAIIIGVFAAVGSGSTAATSLLALVGEAAVAAALIGVRYAWILPLIHGTAAAVFGTNAFGELSAWAWLLTTQPNAGDLICSAGVYLAGLVAIARRPAVSPAT